MRVTRCQICKDVLFTGPSDPMERYAATGEGWSGIPLIVCSGSWRILWRRKWYHQHCAGLYLDHIDAEGHWYVFGSHQAWLEREAQAKRILKANEEP